MKNLKYFIFAAVGCLLAACQNGDWDEPNLQNAPFGNNSIQETNVITIAELKNDATYRSAILASKAKNIEKDIQIKGRVTGNDIGGNIYKQFALQDATGAIIISVNQGGLNGYLPIGQEIIVDLKGLYIGAYGSQPQIGAPYEGSMGRMSKDIWNEHFKIVGGLDNVNPNAIQPEDFSTFLSDNDMNKNAGKLVILKNVKFKGANGKTTFTGDATSGSVNTYVTVGDKDIIIRTSTYADFAKMTLPTTVCNITGIATRFGSDWQILIRKTSDIEILN